MGFFRAVRCSATVATATITAARQIAETTDDEPVFELDLAVSREGAAPYTATVRAVVPPERLARVHPGRRVRVQVDPADPDALRVDWDARP